jgi:hypothetical protein
VLKLAGAPGSDPLVGGAQCIRVNTLVLPADNDIPVQQTPLKLYLPVVVR